MQNTEQSQKKGFLSALSRTFKRDGLPTQSKTEALLEEVDVRLGSQNMQNTEQSQKIGSLRTLLRTFRRDDLPTQSKTEALLEKVDVRLGSLQNFQSEDTKNKFKKEKCLPLIKEMQDRIDDLKKKHDNINFKTKKSGDDNGKMAKYLAEIAQIAEKKAFFEFEVMPQQLPQRDDSIPQPPPQPHAREEAPLGQIGRDYSNLSEVSNSVSPPPEYNGQVFGAEEDAVQNTLPNSGVKDFDKEEEEEEDVEVGIEAGRRMDARIPNQYLAKQRFQADGLLASRARYQNPSAPFQNEFDSEREVVERMPVQGARRGGGVQRHQDEFKAPQALASYTQEVSRDRYDKQRELGGCMGNVTFSFNTIAFAGGSDGANEFMTYQGDGLNVSLNALRQGGNKFVAASGGLAGDLGMGVIKYISYTEPPSNVPGGNDTVESFANHFSTVCRGQRKGDFILPVSSSPIALQVPLKQSFKEGGEKKFVLGSVILPTKSNGTMKIIITVDENASFSEKLKLRLMGDAEKAIKEAARHCKSKIGDEILGYIANNQYTKEFQSYSNLYKSYMNQREGHQRPGIF